MKRKGGCSALRTGKLVLGLIAVAGWGSCSAFAATEDHCTSTGGSATVDTQHSNNANWYTIYNEQGGSCTPSKTNKVHGDLTLKGNGEYAAVWDLDAGKDFVAGLGWRHGSSSASVTFQFGSFNPGSNGYLSLYGWTSAGVSKAYTPKGKTSHIEYYVVEALGPYNPCNDSSLTKTNHTTLKSGGVSYQICEVKKYGPTFYTAPGKSEHFIQYWAVRTSSPISFPMTSSMTVNFGTFSKAWNDAGMDLGSSYDYQVIAAEGYASSGAAYGTVWK